MSRLNHGRLAEDHTFLFGGRPWRRILRGACLKGQKRMVGSATIPRWLSPPIETIDSERRVQLLAKISRRQRYRPRNRRISRPTGDRVWGRDGGADHRRNDESLAAAASKASAMRRQPTKLKPSASCGVCNAKNVQIWINIQHRIHFDGGFSRRDSPRWLQSNLWLLRARRGCRAPGNGST